MFGMGKLCEADGLLGDCIVLRECQDLGEDISGKGGSVMVKKCEVDNVQGKSTTSRCGGE